MQILFTTYKTYQRQVNYLFFGVCTTCVNMLVFYLLLLMLPTISETILDIPAELIAILFAYVTNRAWVFERTDKPILKEAAEFFIGRIGTLVLSLFLIYVFIEKLMFPAMLIKTVITMAVIILNYFISKLFVFKDYHD